MLLGFSSLDFAHHNSQRLFRASQGELAIRNALEKTQHLWPRMHRVERNAGAVECLLQAALTALPEALLPGHVNAGLLLLHVFPFHCESKGCFLQFIVSVQPGPMCNPRHQW